MVFVVAWCSAQQIMVGISWYFGGENVYFSQYAVQKKVIFWSAATYFYVSFNNGDVTIKSAAKNIINYVSWPFCELLLYVYVCVCM